MVWKIKRFDELTTVELYKILKIRGEVFVVEQTCPYLDTDGKDEKCWHLYAEEKGQMIAYARILAKGLSYEEMSIGRVLVKAEYRKKGLARELVQRAMGFITDTLGETKIKIGAQAYLTEFYKSLGFEPVSEIYLEDEIPHIDMIYKK